MCHTLLKKVSMNLQVFDIFAKKTTEFHLTSCKCRHIDCCCAGLRACSSSSIIIALWWLRITECLSIKHTTHCFWSKFYIVFLQHIVLKFCNCEFWIAILITRWSAGEATPSVLHWVLGWEFQNIKIKRGICSYLWLPISTLIFNQLWEKKQLQEKQQ